jgi:chromosome partitioning protein
MIKLAFFNNKGGVGKSTATINVAHSIARLGKRVLVVDCDSQQNTFLFFAEQQNEDYRGRTRYDNLDITLDISLESGDNREYDYAIFDLPPALDERTHEIVSSCDFVIVPIELGKFAIQGLAKVTETIAVTGAKFGGCFVNKFDRENPADHLLDAELRSALKSKAMSTRIPYSRVIKNSISYRETALEYMGWTAPARVYEELTREIMQICGGENNA